VPCSFVNKMLLCFIFLTTVFRRASPFVGSKTFVGRRAPLLRSSSFEEWAGEYAGEAKVAASLVNTAVDLCLEVQASMAVAEASIGTQVESTEAMSGVASVKADETPVTALDFGLQGFFSDRLLAAFPDDRFMGEEDAADLRADADLAAAALDVATKCCCEKEPTLAMESFLAAVDRGVQEEEDKEGRKKRVWILDPIDGTKGLITGQQYVVGLCLVDGEGTPLVAAMGNPGAASSSPARSMLAVKGRGIRFWDGERLLERGGAGDEKPAWTRRSFDYSKLATSVKGAWGEFGSAARRPGLDYPPYLLSRPMDAGSPLPFGPLAPPSTICCGALVKYWAVAVDAVAGFVQYQAELKAWDHAPGILCVNEAGGTATDANGNPVLFPDRVVKCDTAVVCCAGAADDKARHLFFDAVTSST